MFPISKYLPSLEPSHRCVHHHETTLNVQRFPYSLSPKLCSYTWNESYATMCYECCFVFYSEKIRCKAQILCTRKLSFSDVPILISLTNPTSMHWMILPQPDKSHTDSIQVPWPRGLHFLYHSMQMKMLVPNLPSLHLICCISNVEVIKHLTQIWWLIKYEYIYLFIYHQTNIKIKEKKPEAITFTKDEK